jgi:hypothetical protein
MLRLCSVKRGTNIISTNTSRRMNSIDSIHAKAKKYTDQNVDKEIILGRVSKYVTNGSKTAVMDVICFLCESLGSSTVQLHDSLGTRSVCTCSEADLSSQNGDRA